MKNSHSITSVSSLLVCLFAHIFSLDVHAQVASPALLLKGSNAFKNPKNVDQAKPLDVLTFIHQGEAEVQVTDGAGNRYLKQPHHSVTSFTVGGALGRHKLVCLDKKGNQISKMYFKAGVK